MAYSEFREAELSEKPRLQGAMEGEVKWVKWWDGKKKEMSVPFIEEGRQTSFIGGSVSPEWCHRGQHQINHLTLTHLFSASVSLPSTRLP